MRFTRFILVLSLSSACWGSAADDNDARKTLERVRQATETTFGELKSFVCDESIGRHRGTLDGSRAHDIDTVTASLSFENGAEHYYSVRQNLQSLPGLSHLDGAWSEGEFGTLLRQTTQLMRVESVTFLRSTNWDGAPVSVYAFDVSSDDSPWELVMEGRTYRLAFHTEFWVKDAEAQIVRVERTATKPDAATGIAEVRWKLNLHPVLMLGRDWLLPATAEYSVAYLRNNRREWNEIEFTHYRRYGSEVALRFD